LPNEKQGFSQSKNNLKDFAVIENSIRNLRESEVHVTIPKFKIEAEYELKEQLSQLGMSQVFTREADLSGIDGKRDLEVSKVIHKAVVEVNEEGSEAAAATAIIVIAYNMAPDPRKPTFYEFKADHPFVFFIRDNRNGMILFVGQINKL
jgi:serpin B